MNAHKEVLIILAQAAEAELSWYSIANRLGRKGVIIDVNALQILRELNGRGLIERRELAEPPFTLYTITAVGRATVQSDTEA